MKKIIMCIVLMILMSLSVFAINGNSQKEIKTAEKPTGLKNAMIQVNNENSYGHLVQNLERFQNKYQYSCEANCNLELDLNEKNQTQIKQKKQMKFLNFNVESKTEYIINDEGGIESKTRNFWAWMESRNFLKQGAEI